MQAKSRKYLKVIVIMLLITIMGVFYLKDETFDTPNLIITEKEENEVLQEAKMYDNKNNSVDDCPTEITDNLKAERIIIHVCGAVKNPGVYELASDIRVRDAVEAAGGMLPDAEKDYLNLASPVIDGMKIYIPYSEEVDDEQLKKELLKSVIDDSNNQHEETVLVNINTADEAELMELPGIGNAKAAQIIDYRNCNGKFKCIEDIMSVPGIKEGAFNKISKLICTE